MRKGRCTLAEVAKAYRNTASNLCLDCCCYQPGEVDRCTAVACSFVAVPGLGPIRFRTGGATRRLCFVRRRLGAWSRHPAKALMWVPALGERRLLKGVFTA
jgi:hypothetical protein